MLWLHRKQCREKEVIFDHVFSFFLCFALEEEEEEGSEEEEEEEEVVVKPKRTRKVKKWKVRDITCYSAPVPNLVLRCNNPFNRIVRRMLTLLSMLYSML